MIEATCPACGTLNRFADAEVPPGTKFASCSSCKARIPIPIGAKPVGPAKPPTRPTPPPIPVPVPAKRDAVIDLADLPAPRRTSALGGAGESKPAPKSALAAADLPAPKGAKLPDKPAMSEVDDLLAPVGDPRSKIGLTDLPTPKRTSTPAKGIPNIPVIKPPPTGISDLPAPKRAATPGQPPAAKPTDDLVDLPTPKRPADADLPSPKGFFDDLPTPVVGGGKAGAGSVDLPAPKGFFDDLPQPALTGAGRSTTTTDVAPKGFFDDLPQPARPGRGGEDLPAPKGFFDDLPQPATSGKPTTDVAPKGFFDDLPQPTAKPAVANTFFDDLPPATAHSEETAIDLSGAGPMPRAPGELDFDLGPSSAGQPLELAHESGAELDLGLAAPGGAIPVPKPVDSFGDLDLSAPSKPAIRFDTTPKPGSAAAKSAAARSDAGIGPPLAGASKGTDLQLELADTPHPEAQPVSPKKLAKQKAAEDAAGAKVGRVQRTRKIATIALGVVVAGAGGWMFYRHHAAAQLRTETIATDLKSAHESLLATDVNHWQRAVNSAREALELDDSNVEALGIVAEGSLAAALETGLNGPQRIAVGKKMIAKALEDGVTGPELDRAQVLAALAAGQADPALIKLQKLMAANPKDPYLLLYLGWAQMRKGDLVAANKAFDQAIALGPVVKVAALYARGTTKLTQADLDGAHADFAAVLELEKDHVGAQVGLVAAAPPAESAQRQAELIAILNRKDIKNADPRAVTRALSLAGEIARAAGQLDVARDNYNKAIAITPLDVVSLTGLAQVELADNKLSVARDLITKAITQSPDDVQAQLVFCDLAIHDGQLQDAATRLKTLGDRQLPPLQRAQFELVSGRLLQAKGDDAGALEAFVRGAKAAGDLDLAPTMAAVEKLGAMAKASDAANDGKAQGYRDRAQDLLATLEDKAQNDPQRALSLGVAYFATGDLAKAEKFLRQASLQLDKDVEPKLELGKVLEAQGRHDDALDQLRAALAIDPNRADVALELARGLESAGKDADAAKAYDQLLAVKDVPTPARIRAGRFFARTGDIQKAAAQADPILKADPDNAAGHYLKGEGLLAAGQLDDARKELIAAKDIDPDAQYQDALGRAAEATAIKTGDTKFQDLAIVSYQAATAAAPIFNSFAGLGRLYVARQEFEKAIPPLTQAYKLKKDAEVAFNFGLAYQAIPGAHSKDTAIQWFQAAISIEPRPDAYKHLGEVYFDTNNGPAAAQAWTEAVRSGEKQQSKTGVKIDWLMDTYYRLGDLEHSLGHDAAAHDAFRKFIDLNPPHDVHFNTAMSELQH